MPQPLPYCGYPTAGQTAQHGFQSLPEVLPTVDLTSAQPYRSTSYQAVRAESLTRKQLLQMARGIGESFSKRDPLTRHLILPKEPPPMLLDCQHTDVFGTETFGSWTYANIIYWLVRHLLLTQPTSQMSLNDAILAQSLAIVDEEGQVMGGALNESLSPVEPELPETPFLETIFQYLDPILSLLGAQSAEVVPTLCRLYPQFQEAYRHGKVGHHFMVARFDALPTVDTFELVASTMENYQELGYEFVVVEATNQWTGAAFEQLGAIRVHFSPFRAKKTLNQSVMPLEGKVASTDGFMADKDSGSMSYVIRLT